MQILPKKHEMLGVLNSSIVPVKPMNQSNAECSPLVQKIGEHFNSAHYEENTVKEILSKKCLSVVSFHADTVALHHPIYLTLKKILKMVVGIIIFPLGIYWIARFIAASRVMPVSQRFHQQKILKAVKEYADRIFSDDHQFMKIKRLTIGSNGNRIDAYVVSPDAKTLKNRNWILISGGNSSGAEQLALSACLNKGSHFRHISHKLNANLLFYNCAGVMSSEGELNMPNMAKTGRSILNFVLDKKQGLQATRLILMNKSMGGGVSAGARSALGSLDGKQEFYFPSDVKVVVVNDATYSNLVDEINAVGGRCLKWLAQLWRWDVDVAAQSKRLAAEGIPEIILHAKKGDRTIPWKVSLANAMIHHISDLKVVAPIEAGVHFGHEDNPHGANLNKDTQNIIIQLMKTYLNGIKTDFTGAVREFSDRFRHMVHIPDEAST